MDRSAFLSYDRRTAKAADIDIADIVDAIRNETHIDFEHSFEIFFDQRDLPIGCDWARELHGAIDKADIFIPVLTPHYFTRPMCREESKRFYERFSDPGRAGRIFPLLMRPFDAMDTKGDPETEATLQRIKPYQYQPQAWIDAFAALRETDGLRSQAFKDAVRPLARDIIAKLRSLGPTDTLGHVDRARPIPSPAVRRVSTSIEFLPTRPSILAVDIETSPNLIGVDRKSVAINVHSETQRCDGWRISLKRIELMVSVSGGVLDSASFAGRTDGSLIQYQGHHTWQLLGHRAASDDWLSMEQVCSIDTRGGPCTVTMTSHAAPGDVDAVFEGADADTPEHDKARMIELFLGKCALRQAEIRPSGAADYELTKAVWSTGLEAKDVLP